MQKLVYYCDLCGEELNIFNRETHHLNDIVFHTELEEGKECDPYLGSASIDFCINCYDKYLDGNPVHTWAARNSYTFKFVEDFDLSKVNKNRYVTDESEINKEFNFNKAKKNPYL